MEYKIINTTPTFERVLVVDGLVRGFGDDGVAIESEYNLYDFQTYDGLAKYKVIDGVAVLRGQEEIEADRQPTDEQLADQARAKRDKLLADTDWTQVLDAPIDDDTKAAYRTYRQTLRDIPEQDGFPRIITWPEMPAKVKAAPDPVNEAVDLLLSGTTGGEE